MQKPKSYIKTLDSIISDHLYELEESHFVFEFLFETRRRAQERQGDIQLHTIWNDRLISKYYDLLTIREMVSSHL